MYTQIWTIVAVEVVFQNNKFRSERNKYFNLTFCIWAHKISVQLWYAWNSRGDYAIHITSHVISSFRSNWSDALPKARLVLA